MDFRKQKLRVNCDPWLPHASWTIHWTIAIRGQLVIKQDPKWGAPQMLSSTPPQRETHMEEEGYLLYPLTYDLTSASSSVPPFLHLSLHSSCPFFKHFPYMKCSFLSQKYFFSYQQPSPLPVLANIRVLTREDGTGTSEFSKGIFTDVRPKHPELGGVRKWLLEPKEIRSLKEKKWMEPSIRKKRAWLLLSPLPSPTGTCLLSQTQHDATGTR